MTIQEILDELKVEYRDSGHHHCRPGWIQIKHCPFCGSGNYHLGYNLHLKYFSCWKCRGHYGPKVLEAFGLPRERAKQVFPHVDTLEGPDRQERSQISVQEPAGKGPLLASHRKYLEGRGYDPEEISRIWEVEGIGIAARLSWRLYIPIIYRRKRVSWTTRAIGDKVAQRYISAAARDEVINHKALVYGHDFCHHSIVICEGPLDAWKIGPGAGALFGTAFTPAQVKKLITIPRRFVCFDSSPDAQKIAEELCHQLACFPGVTENLLIDAKDPGEASPKEIKLIRRVAGV